MPTRQKTIITLLLLSMSSVYADVDMKKVEAERAEWTRRHFEAEGAPVPDGGVKVVPEKLMSHYEEFKSTRIKNKADVKKFGYIKDSSPDIQSLLNFKNIADHEFKTNAITLDPRSDNLRHSIDELKMGYTFNAVPEDQISKLLGVAPYLNYIDHQGWVGAVEFFETKAVGICSYKENNTKLSHGSVVIAKEEVRDDVNGKITTVDVRGNEGVGFVYNVEWFDTIFFRQLECANHKYDPAITQKVIEIATRIDSNATM